MSQGQFHTLVDQSETVLSIIDADSTGLFSHGFTPIVLNCNKINIKSSSSYSHITVSYSTENELESVGYVGVLQRQGFYRVEIVNYCSSFNTFQAHIIEQLQHVISITRGRCLVKVLVVRPVKVTFSQDDLDTWLVGILGSLTPYTQADLRYTIILRDML